MRRRRIETLVLLVLALLVVWDGGRTALLQRSKMGGFEAGGYVALVGLLLASLVIAYGLSPDSRQTASGFDWRTEKGLSLVAGALALFAGYILLISILGYLLSTALFLAVYIRLFSSYRLAPILVGSFALAISSAYLWASLGMMLPHGFLPWP